MRSLFLSPTRPYFCTLIQFAIAPTSQNHLSLHYIPPHPFPPLPPPPFFPGAKKMVCVETVLTDEEKVWENVKDAKLKSPDYKDMTPDEAMKVCGEYQQ